jgi:hypothetical protein
MSDVRDRLSVIGERRAAAVTDYGEPRMSDVRDPREELRDGETEELGEPNASDCTIYL